MGQYKVSGLILKDDGSGNFTIKDVIWEDYYKFVNFAKADIEKTIVKQPMKWLHNNLSSSHDVTINGIAYKNVTFVIDSIYFKTC